MITKFIKDGNFKLLLSSIENGDNCSVFGLNMGEKLALIEDCAKLFFVVSNPDDIPVVYDKLSRLGKNVEILNEPINIFTSEFNNYKNTLNILNSLKNERLDTLIITPEVMACKFPKVTSLNSFNLNVGDNINITNLVSDLVLCNYKRVDLVSNEGEFSVRGDVIDIYPISYKPTRIYIDFDTIESIKNYNPVTMLTTEEVDCIQIGAFNYFNVDEYTLNNFFTNNKLNKNDLYEDLLQLRNNDYRLIAFDDNVNSSIFEYMPDATIVFDGAKGVYDKLDSYVKNFNEKINSSKDIEKTIYKSQLLNLDEILKIKTNGSLLAFHFIQQNNRIFKPNKVYSIRTLPPVNYKGYQDVLLLDVDNFIKLGFTVILPVGSNDASVNFKKLFEDNGKSVLVYPMLSMCQTNAINIVPKNYPLDLILPDEKLAIISTDNLIGKKKKVIDIENNFLDGEVPNEGDFVVHNFHGIGKCLGVKTLQLSNSFRDYVVIEYKNNDKLYLPVENLDQLSKYVGSDKDPKINKIGGVEFEKVKTKVKSEVKKIAFDLIKLYKQRMDLKGYKYTQDDEMQKRFEDEFGYTETTDQLKAINDCKWDMENGKVMDRLVCGDVGFGKTEVALRIAFKTILGGKQVALLCPTTILSEQHTITAKNRMANFGVKIEVLNRLKTNKEIERIKKDFSDGKIDMLCGTHKLLASDINYKNLGLLILDEEQKFGVADKEKIKNFKNVINVLTLSATPIPRTLNMSLIGVRDISVIETPPTERISADVEVLEYSDDIVKSAIGREISRCGQVLIIFNRVETIYNFASYVRDLVGTNISISVAHGQMSSEELEKEIMKLYSGETQVLISTTLIENGVDLPNANTLIVINSDMLGLSQLYQLKGRIGRSDKKAYAYFTFDSRRMLTETAYKRLQAIKEFSEMGSGFKIAMRDLEIRGAGNLLGLEQSGHIEKIGYNLYVKLLNESVGELKGEKIIKSLDIKIETDLSAYLSQSYVSSMSHRMNLYKQIAEINSDEKLAKFISQTEDIYGDLPNELLNLCKIAYLKNLYASQGVNKLVIKDKCKICFADKEHLTKQIVDSANDYNFVSLNLSENPVIEVNMQNKEKLLDFLISFGKIIGKNC